MNRLFRATISGNVYGELFQHVCHFEVTNDGMTTLEVAAEVRGFFIGNGPNQGIKSWVSNSVKWTSVAAQQIVPAVGILQTITFDQGGQQSPTDGLYLQLCVLLRFQTILSGRRGRGRIYVPGILNGFTTNGRLNAQFHNFADPALNFLRNRFIKDNPNFVGPLALCVASRVTPSQYSPVISIEPSDKTGSQRRRNFA